MDRQSEQTLGKPILQIRGRSPRYHRCSLGVGRSAGGSTPLSKACVIRLTSLKGDRPFPE
ncbi:MAG: hypothetical protein KME20_21090 [Kaiparowitsia implicata GSE-PSE-MK54-09C]|nr:hypothetical protein [Kaiparowitsia implicata GSE-PSE-MK54-09C]